MPSKKVTLYILLALFCLSSTHIQAKDYFFTGVEDALYVNPANWEPNYPGTTLLPEDHVYIQAEAIFIGHNLDVEGQLEVLPGGILRGINGSVSIAQGGKLTNQGEILVDELYNNGACVNGFASTMKLNTYIGTESSWMQNLSSSYMVLTKNLVNKGQICHYGELDIRYDLHNEGKINLNNSSVLAIHGNLMYTCPQGLYEAKTSLFSVRGEKNHITVNDIHSFHCFKRVEVVNEDASK